MDRDEEAVNKEGLKEISLEKEGYCQVQASFESHLVEEAYRTYSELGPTWDGGQVPRHLCL